MSLARAWRRQLYGASSAALIVPFAMLAALLVLALGGGFGQVGVLGQIFAGPPAPSVGSAAASGAGVVGRSLPVIPAAAVRTRPARAGNGSVGTRSARGGAGVVPLASRGPSQTGGAIGGVAPVVSGAPVASKPAPSAPAPAGSPSSSSPSPSPGRSPSPSPSPKPQPTPVDQIVNTITPVASQLPAPAGPAVTQALQAAGSAADSALSPVKLP